jgi:hypothetical protein
MPGSSQAREKPSAEKKRAVTEESTEDKTASIGGEPRANKRSKAEIERPPSEADQRVEAQEERRTKHVRIQHISLDRDHLEKTVKRLEEAKKREGK